LSRLVGGGLSRLAAAASRRLHGSVDWVMLYYLMWGILPETLRRLRFCPVPTADISTQYPSGTAVALNGRRAQTEASRLDAP
jgi:hypothetical protein